MNVAAIDESSTTVGIADSNIYFEGTIEEIKARLDLVQSLGVTDVRLMVPWMYIQTQDPAGGPVDWNADLDWAKLDMIVNEVDSRGMGILGVLQWSPAWATDGVVGIGHPSDVQDFADFAAAVATRYGNKISAYEVWNEPNASFFWNPADPVAYTEMLKATYTSLKAVNQDITVVGAVVGAGLTWGSLTMNPVDFVQAMYDAGADGYFDALSFHPYNFATKFSEGNDVDWAELMPLFQVSQIRELMDQHIDPGEEQLKIWISEYGLPTSVASAQTQVDFMADLINAWQSFSGAGPIFLYTTQDDPNAVGDDRYFGIFNADGTIKDAAALAQLKKIIDCLNGCTTTPTNPVSALLQFIQQLVTNVLSFVPNLIATVVSAVGNVVTQLFNAIRGALSGVGGLTGASVTALAAAKVSTEDAVTAKEASESSSAATGEGEKAKAADAEKAATKETAVTEDVVDEEIEKDATTEESVTPEAEPATTVTEPAEVTDETTPATETSTDTDTDTETVTKPETTEPKATKPDTATTDDGTSKPDATKPESPKPDGTKPDSPKGEGAKGASSSGGDDKAGDKASRPGAKAAQPERGTKPKSGVKPNNGDKPSNDGASTPASTPSKHEKAGAKTKASASSGSGDSE